MQSLHNSQAWAEAHFSKADLGDKRRTCRLFDVAGRMAQNSGRSFSSTSSGEGAYRFIRNKDISPMAVRNAGF